MARGLGVTQKAILGALEGLGRADTPLLCEAVYQSQTLAAKVATRRALRGLVRRGLVVKLGTALHGEGVFCLADRQSQYLWPVALMVKEMPLNAKDRRFYKLMCRVANGSAYGLSDDEIKARKALQAAQG